MYSKKEKELIEYFGYEKFLDDKYLPPPKLYQFMVEHAFCENMSGPAVESLRRCYKALCGCTVYRGTKEWDNLIELEGQKMKCSKCGSENFIIERRWSGNKICKDCNYRELNSERNSTEINIKLHSLTPSKDEYVFCNICNNIKLCQPDYNFYSTESDYLVCETCFKEYFTKIKN